MLSRQAVESRKSKVESHVSSWFICSLLLTLYFLLLTKSSCVNKVVKVVHGAASNHPTYPQRGVMDFWRSAQPGVWAQFIQAKLVCLSTTIKSVFTDTFLGLYTLSTPPTTSPTTFKFIKNH